MTNVSPQIGRPPASLTEAQARRLRAFVVADQDAKTNAERRRRALSRYVRQLRADGASMAAMARCAGLSRQTLYAISDEQPSDERG